MGKTKKNRQNRVNPVGADQVLMNLATLDEELGSRADPIAAIEEQLQSANNEDKMCGLQTLSMLCQNERNISKILSSPIVRIAAPLLVDSDHNIRNAVSGALRNLSAVSVEVCETLVELDVFTPLLILLNEYAADSEWVPIIDRQLNNQLDQKSDTFLHAVNIVWNLCESTSVALETFNQSQLLKSFVKCLNYEVYGMDIAISVSQCLLVISEDNATAWGILSEFTNDFLTLLQLDGDHSCVILRTMIASVMANVPVLAAAHSHLIMDALSKTLDINHRSILGGITSQLPLLEKNEETELEITDDQQMEEETEQEALLRQQKSSMLSPIELEIKNINNLLLAQRIAAETLTNICSSDDENWQEDMEDGSMSEAESVHDYDITATQNPVPSEHDKLPVEILEALKALKIVEKLWTRAQPLPENVMAILRDSGKQLFKRYVRLRASVLMCLQNFCNILSTEDLGGANAIYTVWLELGQQVFQENLPDSQVIEASTALMRSTLEHLRKHANLFQQMTENDLQLMLKGIGTCTESETRANWMKMLGVLGAVLPEAFVKEIVKFMTEACLKETDCWALSEAVDAFMDIFGDNDWPQIICELQLTQVTREIERIFKTKIRQSKKSLGDRYLVVNTVRTNLQRFCKYLDTQEKAFKNK